MFSGLHIQSANRTQGEQAESLRTDQGLGFFGTGVIGLLHATQ